MMQCLRRTTSVDVFCILKFRGCELAKKENALPWEVQFLAFGTIRLHS